MFLLDLKLYAHAILTSELVAFYWIHTSIFHQILKTYVLISLESKEGGYKNLPIWYLYFIVVRNLHTIQSGPNSIPSSLKCCSNDLFMIYSWCAQKVTITKLEYHCPLPRPLELFDLLTIFCSLEFSQT